MKKRKTWSQTQAQLVDTLARETQRTAEKALLLDRLAMRALPDRIFSTAEGGALLGLDTVRKSFPRLQLLELAGYIEHKARDQWRKTEHGKEFERCEKK